MRSLRRYLSAAFAGALAVLLCASCAPPVIEKEKVDLVWPLPPETPRVRFIDDIRSSQDLGAKDSGLGQALFGETQVHILSNPYGVAVDGQQRIYVSDMGRVVVFDLTKKRSYLIGVDSDRGRVKAPVGIAASGDGRLFVGDAGAARIFVYDTNSQGAYLTAMGQKGEIETPSGLALDEKRRRLYVVDSKRHHVAVFSLDDYRRLGTIGKRGVGPAEFNFPTNAAVDALGNLYVVDTGNFRVQVFDPEERHIRTLGKVGDSAGSFARPKGVALDSEGHIYVVDAAFQNFQILDQEGRPLIAIGKGGRDPGSFLLPAGMTIDSEDRIYVVDQMTARVQIFQYLGEKWKARQATAPAATGGTSREKAP